MPEDVTEPTHARGGLPGPPASDATAAARQLERDRLDELIAVAEAEHGPITDEEIHAKREALRRARGPAAASDGAPDPAA